MARGGNGGNRIGDIFSGNIRRAAMNRLEKPDLGSDTGGGQHADRPGQHRRFIAKISPKMLLQSNTSN